MLLYIMYFNQIKTYFLSYLPGERSDYLFYLFFGKILFKLLRETSSPGLFRYLDEI